jgi:hypothetical protein
VHHHGTQLASCYDRVYRLNAIFLEFLAARSVEPKRLPKPRNPTQLQRHLGEDRVLTGEVHPESLHRMNRVWVDRLEQQQAVLAQARMGESQAAKSSRQLYALALSWVLAAPERLMHHDSRSFAAMMLS